MRAAHFSSAWEQVKSNYGTYLGVSLVAWIMLSCLSCISWFLMGPVLGGVYYVALKGQRGEPVEFGMMFEGFKKFLPLMAIGLIQIAPMILLNIIQFAFNIGRLGLIFSNPEAIRQVQRTGELGAGEAALTFGMSIVYFAILIIWIVWAIAMAFVVPLVLEHDLSPIEAIKTSARAAFSNLGGLIVAGLLAVLVGFIGLLLLCLGILFVSVPIIFVANAIVYRQVFPRQDVQQGYFTPPPPGTYGFGSPQY